MWHGVVAAVNLHIASEASFMIGLGSSEWTRVTSEMVRSSMSDDDFAHADSVNLVCNGSRHGLFITMHPAFLEQQTLVSAAISTTHLPCKLLGEDIVAQLKHWRVKAQVTVWKRRPPPEGFV